MCVCVGEVLCRSPWGSFLQLGCLGKKIHVARWWV